MPKQGIGTPTRANGRGGLHLPGTNEHVRGLLGVALSPCHSSNPFQQIGIQTDITFDLADNFTFTKLIEDIEEIMDEFEKEELATLQNRPDNLYLNKNTDGEYEVIVHILNLQTDNKFAATVRSGKAGLTVT
jgi:hypothetical protein